MKDEAKTKKQLLAEMEEIRRRISELEISKTAGSGFYLSLLEELPAPVWRAGIDAKRNYFNKAWLVFTGRGLEQEIGEGWAEGIHPEDMEKSIESYIDAFNLRQPFDIKYRLRRYDGEYRWIVDSGVPFNDPNGNFAGYIALCHDITEYKILEERIHNLAYHDSLTALPNRLLFNDRLNQALALAKRNKWHIAVMSIDIDRFKSINVNLGYDIGDLVLKTIANRLKECMRESDTVARLGGDEFIVVLTYIKERDEAAFAAHRILKWLAKVFIARDQEFSITVSIGISVYPADGEDIKTLLRNSDAAMYFAKEQGGDRYEFYVPL